MTEVAGTPPNVASAWIDGLIASNRGNQLAFVYAQKRYSYTDVAALMNRAGNLFQSMRLAPGAPVLVLLPGSPAMVATLLGAMKAGAMPIVGAPREDAEALRRCVTACSPAAAVVHENDLPAAGPALAGIPQERVVVVGTTVPAGYRSFVDAIRSLSSWLAAGATAEDAPALSRWDGTSLRTASHAQLAAEIESATRGEPLLSGDAQAMGAMLRAFAAGDEATLPPGS